MSRRGSIVIRLMGVLLMLGVLFAVGVLAFQAGQAQGYALGVSMAAEGATVPPSRVVGYPYWGQPFFGFAPVSAFLGLLCLGGLGLAFLFALGAIFRPRHWYGPRRDCADEWRGWHGGPPPWVKEKGKTPDATSKAESSATSGQTQSSVEAG